MSDRHVRVPLEQGQGPGFSNRLMAHIAPRSDSEVVDVCKRVASRQAPGLTPSRGIGIGGRAYAGVTPEGEVCSKGKVYYTNADPVPRPLEKIYAQVLPFQTVTRRLRRTEPTTTRGQHPSSSLPQETSSAGPAPALTPGNSIRSSSTRRSMSPAPAPDKPLPPLPGSRGVILQGGGKLLTRLRSVRELPRIEDLSLDADTEAELDPWLDYLPGEADPKTPLASCTTHDASITQDPKPGTQIQEVETGSVLDDLTREADDLISEYASLATTHDTSATLELSTDDDIWYEELTSWEYAAGRQAEAERRRDEIVKAVREAEEERSVREWKARIRAREVRVRALVEARRKEMRREREGRK